MLFASSLYDSLLSPLREDSSTDNFPLIIIPSAATLSPLVKIMISPTTTSSIGISFASPFLFTFIFILLDSSCIRANALLEPYSLTADMIEATTIATTIPIVSK